MPTTSLQNDGIFLKSFKFSIKEELRSDILMLEVWKNILYVLLEKRVTVDGTQKFSEVSPK